MLVADSVPDPRETLGGSFDTVAAGYDDARPEYPDELFDTLVELTDLRPGSRLLEIGCATGKATLPLVRRGFSVVCVERGPNLAALARQRFGELPVELHLGTFEDWEGEWGAFELVYAATAWHWVDPEVRYRKAHRLLRAGGHLAFWSAMLAYPEGFDPFFTELQEVYDEISESWQGAWPPPPPSEMHDDRAEILASGLFEDVEVRRFAWEKLYTAEQYISLIGTFSGHIAMPDAKREHLYREIRRRVAKRPDARVRRHWCSILHVARTI
jgi:SAM-dependent methyltransferase